MTPMRIVTVGHSYVVGLNRAVMARVARHPEVDLTVVAPRFFHGDLRPLTLEPEADAPYRLVGASARLTRHVHVFAYRGLRDRLGAAPVDILHAWEEPYILAGYQLARLARSRRARFLFQTCQNLAKQYPPPFANFERYCVRHASGWSAIGRTVQEVLRARGYPEPSEVIPLGIDEERFRPDAAAGAAVRGRLGLEGPVIGFVGRLTAQKGLDVLMTALESVPGPWSLLALGSGPYEETLKNWAARRGLGGRVRVLLARHDEVPAHLRAMDLLVAPSLTAPNWREQFGRMIVEAFACGVPVIGSDSGEIPHVIGDAGLVVPEGDAPAWAAAIAALIQSPDRRRDLAAAGLDRALTHFSSARAAEQHVDLFRRVMQSPPR